jgi:hypothetical protein
MNKIFVFSNVRGGGDGPALALADDGTCLGSHWCSHEGYAPHDLGVIEGTRPDRHETYKKHFPNGYEMEFVPSAKYKGHEGLQKAIALNKIQGEEAERASCAKESSAPENTSEARLTDS